MKKKYLAFALIPAFALIFLGTSVASAHGFGMFGGNATPEEIVAQHTEMFTKQAALVGISVDQFKAEWAQGKTLPEIAEAHGVTEAQLQEKMKAVRKTHMQTMLQTLVEKGVITQDQATARLNAMETKVQNGKGLGKGFHGMGMMKITNQ